MLSKLEYTRVVENPQNKRINDVEFQVISSREI